MRRALLLGLLLALPTLVGCLGTGEEPLVRTVTPQARPDGEQPTAGAPQGATQPAWAAPAEAEIRPGVAIHTEAGDCPSNFVFQRPEGTALFIGTTAYCVRDLPIGALVTLGDAERIAVLVYSSWITMQEVGETDPDALEYNDFAVIYFDEDLRRLTSPALPEVGGPVAMGEPGAAGVGARVRAFARDGASPAAPGAPAPADAIQAPTAWRDGVVTGKAGDWALLVHSPRPATPGSMGGAVVSPEGEALGVVVNVGVLPNPGANGVARLDALMAYAAEHAKLYMDLVTWDLVEEGAR